MDVLTVAPFASNTNVLRRKLANNMEGEGGGGVKSFMGVRNFNSAKKKKVGKYCMGINSPLLPPPHICLCICELFGLLLTTVLPN